MIFRQEALNAQNRQLDGSVLLKLPHLYRTLVWLAVCFLLLLIVFFIYGEYTRRQPAIGQVLPESGVTRIWGQRAGVVLSVEVSEGDLVTQGQVLADIGTAKDMLGGDRLEEKQIDQIAETIANLEEAIAQQKQYHLAETEQLQRKTVQAERTVKKRKVELKLERRRLRLIQEEKRDLEKLQEKGYVSKVQLSGKRREELEARLGLERLGQSVEEAEDRQTDFIGQKALLTINHKMKMAEYDREMFQQQRLLVDLQGRQGYALIAPVAGRMAFVQKQVGQLIDMNEPFALIVPENAHYEVELIASSQAIGFLEQGQRVRLRYQAFPYQRYGLYTGRIRSVSAAGLGANEIRTGFALPNTPHYRVKVTLDKQFVTAGGRKVPLRSGMMVEADLVLDKLPVWYWLFEPVLSIRATL